MEKVNRSRASFEKTILTTYRGLGDHIFDQFKRLIGMYDHQDPVFFMAQVKEVGVLGPLTGWELETLLLMLIAYRRMWRAAMDPTEDDPTLTEEEKAVKRAKAQLEADEKRWRQN